MATPIIVQARARQAAEDALRLVRERGGWLATPGGRVRGYEADGVVLELHTPFAGSARVGERDRYLAALDGRDLPHASTTLLVRDEWEAPALVAVVGDDMRVKGIARYREGGWVHEVAAGLRGVPAYVAREDADDLRAAGHAVRQVACGMWRGGHARALYLGVFMGLRALWTHSSLLPLVLAEAVPGCGDLEVDAGAEMTLTRACVKRVSIDRPAAFEGALRRVFRSWHVHHGEAGDEVGVGLEKGRDCLDAEMRRLGIGDLCELEVRVAMAAPFEF